MSPRVRYILFRLAMTVPTLLAMTLFVFLLLRLVPGDPAETMLGLRATPENVAEVRSQLGLDRPLPEQYLGYLGDLVRGDFGVDFQTGAAVTELLASHLPVTLELTVLSVALALLVGIPIGVMIAGRRRGVGKVAASAYVTVGTAIPNFWLGLMAILVFAAFLGWLPPSGFVPLSEGVLENVKYMALPSLTLAFGMCAYIVRTTSSAVEESLADGYQSLLQAKGLRRRSILFKHSLRNAGPPIVTVVAIQIGVLLGGAIVVEEVFALPGIGSLTVQAVSQRNYVLIQGCIMVVAMFFILVNLIADVMLGVLNPRIAEGVQR